MKSLLTILLLAAALLPAFGHAQTVNICDRTPQVREAILAALEAADCAAVNSQALASLESLSLQEKQLTSWQANDFAGLTNLRFLSLSANQLTTLPAGAFNGLTSLETLVLGHNQLTRLPAGVFSGLTSLETLTLGHNQLASLPDGVFDGLTNLRELFLHANQLTRLPAGVFSGLTNLEKLLLSQNQLASLPAGVFSGLTSLEELTLGHNQLASLPAGVFSGLTSLEKLLLSHNQLASLLAGVFSGLTSLEELTLGHNQLASLPAGVFSGLTSLETLDLTGGHLSSLPAGVFAGLTSLETLHLGSNLFVRLPAGVFSGLTSLETLDLTGGHLSSLPEGVFAGLTSLRDLRLGNNYLARLNREDFAAAIPGATINWEPQFSPWSLVAAVPLMVSPSDSMMRQGFVRIINESNQSGSVRILAYDDAGTAANPVEIQLGANQAFDFKAEDLENGNTSKGINMGIGSPPQGGDWRLGVESTELDVRVLSFVRTDDGFLTMLNNVRGLDTRGNILLREDFKYLPVDPFNPASNTRTVSKMRLINPEDSEADVSIWGVDDGGNRSRGTVSLTLAAGETRTLSAQDLETGAQGLTGMLGDGAGKWSLRIDAGPSIKHMDLLESPSGHLSNFRSQAVFPAAWPDFFLSEGDNRRESFLRIGFDAWVRSTETLTGTLRIAAFDDGGTPGEPVVVQTSSEKPYIHFNSGDLESGNPKKGVESGFGPPVEGDWRLRVEHAATWAELGTFVRHANGFVSNMRDLLLRDSQNRLAAFAFFAPSDDGSVSKLRLFNTGESEESVSIRGVDDGGNRSGPVSLTLAAGETRTLTARQLEGGDQGLTGMLGDGAGNWRLFIEAGRSVYGKCLLESSEGLLSNLSKVGFFINGEADTGEASLPTLFPSKPIMGRELPRRTNLAL